jgi:hypothetical protein
MSLSLETGYFLPLVCMLQFRAGRLVFHEAQTNLTHFFHNAIFISLCNNPVERYPKHRPNRGEKKESASVMPAVYRFWSE